MRRPLFLILALLLAATFISCGGSADTTTEPGEVASSEPSTAGFDVDRFFDQLIDDPPLGLVMVMTRQYDFLGQDAYEHIREVKLGTGSIRKSEITETRRGAGGEGSIQVRIIGDTMVFRTIINSRESGWMKISPDEVSGGLFRPQGNYDSRSWFGYDPERRKEWTFSGEAPCRVGQCFVIVHPNDSTPDFLIDKTTYAVVGYVFAEEDEDGQITESVTEIFNWGEDPGFGVPPGTLPEATPRDFEEAFNTAYQAARTSDEETDPALPAAIGESDARSAIAREPYPPPLVLAREPFDMDRFLGEIIDRPPNGVVFVSGFAGGDSASPEIQMSTEISVAFGDAPASNITLTMSGPGGEATIQFLDIGGESYIRTVIAGETSERMKAAPGARTEETLGVTGAIAYSIFRRDSFNPAEWFAAGQVRCRDRDCFVLRHRFDDTRRLLIDSSTYAPVQTGWFEGLANNLTPINVTDIFDWGADLKLQEPAGDVPVANSAEILQAFQAATQAALASTE